MHTLSDHDFRPLPLESIGRTLSACLAAFGAWAWLLSAGLWTGEVNATSAGFILLAVLSVVLQIASNYAAAAARRASAYRLASSYRWAVGLMVAGGAYNAFSLHHAWEATGLVPPIFPFTAEAMAANAPILVLSAMLAGFEPAIYWIDEALRSEAGALRAHADRAEQTERQARYDAISQPRFRGGELAAGVGVAALTLSGGMLDATASAAEAPKSAKIEINGKTRANVRLLSAAELARREEAATEMLTARASINSTAKATGLSRHHCAKIQALIGFAATQG